MTQQKEQVEIPNGLSEKVRELRVKKGWTLSDLSEHSGLSISYLSSIERRTRAKRPSMETLQKLATAFQIPVYKLHDQLAGDLEHYSETELLIARFPAPVKEFLFEDKSIPYILCAKRLFELQVLKERDILRILNELFEQLREEEAQPEEIRST